MRFKIFWLDSALEILDSTAEYIKLKWGENASQLFLNKTIRKINLLVNFSTLGIKTNQRKNIRKLVISKNTSVYYQITKNKIIILTLFDTRQDINKLKL